MRKNGNNKKNGETENNNNESIANAVEADTEIGKPLRAARVFANTNTIVAITNWSPGPEWETIRASF